MLQARQIIPLLLILSSTIVCSLHLNLIHKHSIHSPLFPGNLTADERQLQLYADDEARGRLLERSLSGLNYSEEHLRPHVVANKFAYMVELSIGTPTRAEERRTYYLALDTGSGIVWLQCEPCINCWNQTTPIYDPSKDSTTFAPIPCSHPLCDLRKSGWECINNRCHYSIRYATPAFSKGVLASETLAFASSAGSARTESVHHFVFGCARDNRDFRFSGKLAGVFGLDMRLLSSTSQMESAIGGRFAYCLPRFTDNAQPPSRLKFGDDAILHGPHVKTLEFVHVPGKFKYYLPLIDVSIASHRIGFEPGTFTVHRQGQSVKGGFVVDTGAAYTIFVTGGPYELIIEAFKKYFKPFKLQKKHSTATKYLKLCYEIPRAGFTAFPSMTLHFKEGNDIVVQPPNVVVQTHNEFCIAVATSLHKVSVLGAYQQHDYKISYDVRNKALSYAPADLQDLHCNLSKHRTTHTAPGVIRDAIVVLLKRSKYVHQIRPLYNNPEFALYRPHHVIRLHGEFFFVIKMESHAGVRRKPACQNLVAHLKLWMTHPRQPELLKVFDECVSHSLVRPARYEHGGPHPRVNDEPASVCIPLLPRPEGSRREA